MLTNGTLYKQTGKSWENETTKGGFLGPGVGRITQESECPEFLPLSRQKVLEMLCLALAETKNHV